MYMSRECVICFKEINNDTEINTYTFSQNCQCFYDVHEECLADWLKVKSSCLICGKNMKFYKNKQHKPFKENSGCCVIL